MATMDHFSEGPHKNNEKYSNHSIQMCARDQDLDTDYAPVHDRRPNWVKNPTIGLVCLNMLVCGIEFCASAGCTYIPPMLLKDGFSETSMTCVMGIGPFLALLSVPVLGRWSDRCQSRWGRRRPFIFGISMLMIISLILIAYGQKIGAIVAPTLRLGVVLLVSGVVFLEYGCHAGFNPCEALVADRMKHSEDKERGFTVYSNMVSLGGCIGYLITAVDWSHSVFTWFFDNQEQTVFTFILMLYVGALITTLLFANEQPHVTSSIKQTFIGYSQPTDYYLKVSEPDVNYSDDIGYETGSNDSQEESATTATSLSSSSSSVLPLLSTSSPSLPITNRTATPTTELFFKPIHIGRSLHFQKIPLRVIKSSIRTFITWPVAIIKLPQKVICSSVLAVRRFLKVPLVLRILFMVDFCSWTALMCHNMFYTDYVGQAIYGGNPNAEESSSARRLYDSGVRMGSWGLLLHSITSILYASFIQKMMIKWYGLRRTYFTGLAVFTICMTGTLLSNNLTFINILAALSGTGFAAITTVPYMLVTAYHSNKQVYFSDCPGHEDECDIENSNNGEDESESRGFGADIAVLNAAYFLSQIILSLFVGTIVDLLHSVRAYIAISAIFGLLACYCTTKVIYPPKV